MYRSGAVLTLIVFAILTLASHLKPAHGEIDEVSEPPLDLKLEVDGQAHNARLGQPANVTIDGKEFRLLVTKSDTRELSLRHLRFRYPSYFKFEVSYKHETEWPVRWDLEGQDADITVFRASSNELRYQSENRPLNGWLTTIFKTGFVEGDAVSLNVGRTQVQGTKYTVPLVIGDETCDMIFEAYEVPGKFGNARYFLLLTGWDGENPEEEQLLRDLLRETFEVIEENAIAE